MHSISNKASPFNSYMCETVHSEKNEKEVNSLLDEKLKHPHLKEPH